LHIPANGIGSADANAGDFTIVPSRLSERRDGVRKDEMRVPVGRNFCAFRFFERVDFPITCVFSTGLNIPLSRLHHYNLLVINRLQYFLLVCVLDMFQFRGGPGSAITAAQQQ
jgi:hypothetical protein